MEQYDEVIRLLLETVKAVSGTADTMAFDGMIPVGVSNRHVHLSKKDLDKLFGVGYQLTNIKDLSQPGQYACKETITLCGPKGAIEKVRVLGPVRNKTQVEILSADCFKLGCKSAVRLSGDLNGTPGLTLTGPKGSVEIAEGVVVAKRHIHMTPSDAVLLGVHDGQEVSIEADGPRGGVLKHVMVRATSESGLECHLDTEEANAIGADGSTKILIKK